MSTWKAVVTEKGDALLAKMTQGRTLEITHAEIGAGQVDLDLLKQQTSVSTMKQTATIEPVGYPEEGMCALPVTITNEGVAASYSAWQIGIFANDPDEGKILFFIAQAEDAATNIPSAALMPSYKTQVIFHVEYGAADSVNVDVNPANAVSQAGMENYVNAKVGNAKEVLEAHTASKDNPHGVTKSQVGLGNVPNVATNNQTPTYTQASTLATLASGEKLSTSMGKIMKAITDLISHIANKTNPHGVTAAQIGLGNVDNTADNDKYVAYAQRAGSADKTQSALTLRLNGGRTEGTDMWNFDGSTGRTINVTPEKVGAAEAEHEHDAAEVTSGTLDLARLPKDELVNLHVWKRFSSEPSTTFTDKTNVRIAQLISSSEEDNYSTEVIFDAVCNTKTANPANGKGISITSIAQANKYLKGKYIRTWEGKAYVLDSDTTFSIASEKVSAYLTYYYLQADTAREMTCSPFLDMVASKDSDTYPTSGKHTDGYWYEYHKQLGE